MNTGVRLLTSVVSAALISWGVAASPAFAKSNEEKALEQLLEDLSRQDEPRGDSKESFELPVFKTIKLPNLFGVPGYTPLEIPVYRSKGKLGPGILLVHGNSSSSRSYVEQVFSKFGDNVRLYLIDLPGFGRSQKIDPSIPLPPTPLGIPLGFPEYQLGLVEAVATVAADPELAPKVFVGWSLGGNVLLAARGFGFLPDARGLLIFGTAPAGADIPTTTLPGLPPALPGFPTLSILPSFGLALQLDPTSPVGFNLDGSFDDPVPPFAPAPINASATVGEAYIRAFFGPLRRMRGEVPAFFFEDGFLRSDRRARASLGSLAFLPPLPLPDEFAVLQGLVGDPADPSDDVPIAVLAGGEERFLNIQYLRDLVAAGIFPTLWNGKIIEIQNAGHAIHYESPARFNEVLLRFVIDLMQRAEERQSSNAGGRERPESPSASGRPSAGDPSRPELARSTNGPRNRRG